MIKLEKGEEPAVLARNWADWTTVVVEKIAAGEKPANAERRRYNHVEIKQALVAETSPFKVLIDTHTRT